MSEQEIRPGHVPQVRMATVRDVSTIAGFNCAMAAETEGKALDPATVQRGVQHLIEHPDAGFYRVAERNGQIVGSLMITGEWSDWRNGVYWWIQSVYVIPAARRQGVFRALYRSVAAEAQQRGDIVGLRLYVEKDNQVAQRTYRELGMARSHYWLFETPDPLDRT